MKIRKGFVSNSSSSSFVVRKDVLTDAQLVGIYFPDAWLEAEEHGLRLDVERMLATIEAHAPDTYHVASDCWRLHVSGDMLEGYTDMDNFDMFWFMKEKLGVPMDKVDKDEPW